MRNNPRIFENSRILFYALIVFFVIVQSVIAQDMFITETEITATIDKLISKYGEAEQVRIGKGVRQTAGRWHESDGTFDEFSQFCLDNFIADKEQLNLTADRYEEALASIGGNFGEMGRKLSWHITVDKGPIAPIDYHFAKYSPSAHFNDDMFNTKIAFIALLNFPLYTLDERLEYGPAWNREQWTHTRLAERFSTRIPSEVSQQNRIVFSDAGNYISSYYIYMSHLLDADGNRHFPEGQKCITHWNLRDELKSCYAKPDGLANQEMIYQVMLKIINQEIPKAVINNPGVDWSISINEVTVSPVVDGPLPDDWKVEGKAGDKVDNSREPDNRYIHLLNIFHAMQRLDKYYPELPNLMDRRFMSNREIPEAEVERLLESITTSETMAKIGKLIEKRLGRKLKPFDIWYDGFKARSNINTDELDSIVRGKYANAKAFEADLPNILGKLGFDNETIEFLVSRIKVDPSRGIGHASGPGLKSSMARLRTRVAPKGMDYKGYNIATHELGHNVEQVLSLHRTDNTLLRGVPNTAFSEAFAFVFQSRDLELLGIENNNPDAEDLKVLDIIWGIYEIGAVALVDMAVWNWMYDNPEATPAELKEAVINIAKEKWNKYFSPVFGLQDVEILAIYSHMIDAAMYLPDYPIGSIIEFQIEEYMKGKNLAEEMERMCSTGSITPGLWMKTAVGSDISTEPLLQAADEAVRRVSE